MLLLRVHPARHLVDDERALGHLAVELRDLGHGLLDRRAGLAELRHELRVVEDAAGHLAVAASEAQHQVQGRLLLDVVVAQRAAIFQLLAREDEALLVGRDALLVLDLLLHVVDRVARLHVERDGLAGEGFHEDLRGRACFGGSFWESAVALKRCYPTVCAITFACVSLSLQ